jgi:16S rRNA (adenine1518-N6/adenine1519-N6)-dimethyltransferase
VDVPSEEFFFKVVRAAFSMRRKTAQNGLSNGLSVSKQTAAQALEAAGLSPTVRAESLTLEELAELARQLHKLIG